MGVTRLLGVVRVSAWFEGLFLFCFFGGGGGLILCFVSPDLPLPGECRADGLCQGVFRGEECQEIPGQPGQTAQGDLQVGLDGQVSARFLVHSIAQRVLQLQQ